MGISSLHTCLCCCFYDLKLGNKPRKKRSINLCINWYNTWFVMMMLYLCVVYWQRMSLNEKKQQTKQINEEEKNGVSYFCLHYRLFIEQLVFWLLNFSPSLSVSDSLFHFNLPQTDYLAKSTSVRSFV